MILSPFVHFQSVITCLNMSFLLLVGYAGYPVPFFPGSLLYLFSLSPLWIYFFVWTFLEFASTFGLLCFPASKQNFLSLHSFPAFASLLIPTQIELLANACRRSAASIHIDLTNVALLLQSQL